MKEIGADRWTRFLAVYVAILASALGVVSMLGNNASEEATRQAIDAANFFAWYQAKTTRQQIAGNSSTLAQRYETERRELLEKANAATSARESASKRDRHYDFAITLLQIAVALAAAEILMNGLLLFTISFLLFAAAGTVSAIAIQMEGFSL